MNELEVKDYYYSYEELVDSFGVEIVLDEHDNDYQGDSYYLLKNGDQYGTLVFGWGSCSGCDALQACDGYKDALELRDSLWEDVVWRELAATREWADKKDWEGEWYYQRDAGRKFIERLLEHLA